MKVRILCRIVRKWGSGKMIIPRNHPQGRNQAKTTERDSSLFKMERGEEQRFLSLVFKALIYIKAADL